MATDFRLTGKHVLAMLIGFFLVITAANAVFIHYAMNTFPGEKEKKSYLQGLNYNERLAARAEQASRGWAATIEEASLKSGRVELRLKMTGSNGSPISDLDIFGVLSRPASDIEDHVFVFSSIGNGEYIAQMPAAAGVWELEGRAVSGRDEEFVFTNRLILE